jgi:hypothetical protein
MWIYLHARGVVCFNLTCCVYTSLTFCLITSFEHTPQYIALGYLLITPQSPSQVTNVNHYRSLHMF